MKNITAKKSVDSYSEGRNWKENQVVEHYQYWIKSVVSTATKNLPRYIVDWYQEEMEQNATIALLLRWRKYQKKKIEIPFCRYAWLNVRGAVVDTFRNRRKEHKNIYFVENHDPQIMDETYPANSQDDARDAQIDLSLGIQCLEEWEQNFINLMYFEGRTLKYIGSLGGVTESRACQIHTKILNKLRKHMRFVDH